VIALTPKKGHVHCKQSANSDATNEIKTPRNTEQSQIRQISPYGALTFLGEKAQPRPQRFDESTGLVTLVLEVNKASHYADHRKVY